MNILLRLYTWISLGKGLSSSDRALQLYVTYSETSERSVFSAPQDCDVLRVTSVQNLNSEN